MDPECPACGSTRNDEIAEDVFECQDCYQVFNGE